jgi:toxin-antitoxin system PIN domain toxin
VSYSIDVNILLYASDRSSPKHQAALSFLESRSSGGELFCLAWPVMMSYLRIATHPRIFSHPISPKQALDNVEALLNLPHVRVLAEGEGFLNIYREVAGAFPVRGNLVPDAHLAALLRQHDVPTLYTNDADFRKFPFLKVLSPFG